MVSKRNIHIDRFPTWLEKNVNSFITLNQCCLSGLEFGDAVLSGFQEEPTVNNSIIHQEHKAEDFDDLKLEVGPTMATSLFKHVTMKKKSGMFFFVIQLQITNYNIYNL